MRSERGRKPVINSEPEFPEKLFKREPEDYCHFCEDNYIYTPPEKARVTKDKYGKWKKTYYIDAGELEKEYAEFRRVGNLFEIVTFDYWHKNYGYKMSDEVLAWQDKYLSSKEGMKHIMNVLGLKMKMMGMDFDNMPIEERVEKTAPFFGGCHELIIGKRHYCDGAQYLHQICSSGSLTPDEHFEYMKLVVETIVDISVQNPYIRYVSVFQNWLRPAGASFDHLHKQLVGLDEWGVQINHEVKELIKNPNLYNELAANLAIYNDFVIAENDYAIAFSELGHRFPTVAIYSKSPNSRPFEHTDREIRGMSDIVHAIHCALTNQTTCNEEWYYAPFDCVYNSPWRILIKLRIHNPAGFEGNTKIYINPVSPETLRNAVVEKLLEKREAGYIGKKIRIGEEVSKKPNPLLYYKGNSRLKGLK